MILDETLKGQLAQYLEMLENDIEIKLSVSDDETSKNMKELVETLSSMSPKITIEEVKLKRTPSFSVNRKDEDTGIVFSGVPLGQEFTSLILALLQVSGRAPKIDDDLAEQVKNIDEELNFETFISLSCQVCPEVVQALNIMSVLNPKITHTMIDGAVFKDEVDSLNIRAVPSAYLNGEPFGDGWMTVEEILAKLGGGPDASEFESKDPFDMLIVGGGPGGASAAIYGARKGLRTGIVAERFGGQILDTATIENFIGTKYTEGPQLANQIEEHVKDYDIDIMNLQQATYLEKNDDFIEIGLENGASLESKSVIIATGARWRTIDVPGEEEFRNNGVAYCPHCDGPLFEGQKVAVIGGGNSGVEAAIDLAAITEHVTILERSDKMKADSVLLDRLHSLENVTVVTHAQTTEITGTDTVNGLTYTNTKTNLEEHIELSGVFVQIGLVPNTNWLEGTVERNEYGEVMIDENGATNVPGVYAAGDCTDIPYNQIITSMGAGSVASLSASDYLVRHPELVK